MKLDVLPDCDVGKVARMLAREAADGAKLMRRNDAVGDADAHHEVIGGKTFAALAASGSNAVALCVDAPPLEVHAGPIGNNTGAAFTREGTHFVKCFPGVLCELQTFNSLGLCLFRLYGFSHRTSLGNLARNRKPAAAKAVSRALRKPWSYGLTTSGRRSPVAREAAYSDDNRSERPCIDIRRMRAKMQIACGGIAPARDSGVQVNCTRSDLNLL